MDETGGVTTRCATAEPADPAAGVDAGELAWILRGRGLRFVLVNEMMRRRSMTVAEMVAMIGRYGYQLGGRASKVISDALRWEVRRGRVVRIARGLYAYRRAPVSTARRIRIFADHCREAITGAVSPLSAGPAKLRRQQILAGLPAPPWVDLRWLWAV